MLGIKGLDRFLFFGGLAYFLFLFLSRVGSSIILPFGVSFIFSYLVASFVNRFAVRDSRISRTSFSLLLIMLCMTVIFVVIIFLIPILFSQVISLIDSTPKLFSYVARKYSDLRSYVNSHDLLSKIIGHDDLPSSVWTLVPQNASEIVISFLSEILDIGKILKNLVSMAILFPVISFYMIRDWNTMSDKFFSIIPEMYQEEARGISMDIRSKLSGCLVGQMKVVFFISIFYCSILSVFGVQYSVLIGVLSGMLTFIPFIGAFLSFLVASLTIFTSSLNPMFHFTVVSIVFLVGQVLEGNFMTPRFVGENVDLHPVWIIFGFLCGGVFGGFSGIVFALPITAVTSVLVKHFIKVYKKSRYYSR